MNISPDQNLPIYLQDLCEWAHKNKLSNIIESTANLANRDIQEILDQIVRTTGLPSNEKDPLASDVIQKINTTIRDILQ